MTDFYIQVWLDPVTKEIIDANTGNVLGMLDTDVLKIRHKTWIEHPNLGRVQV
jgi:hypothetical protein